MAERGERRIEIPGYGGFEEIGRGGFAVVYQAEQEILQRHVAVKVITLLDVTDDSRRRFRLECTTIGGLAWHPNIVTVFDAGDTPEGWPYLVMEYLPGGSFGDRMRAGPLRWQEVVDVGVKVAGALQAAHDEGAIHRDVKPDNILMGRAGEPKLGDFGIATLQNGTASRTGSLTATLAYAAPEVLSGARASAASDVYSLAATLHALCTGATPFVTADDEHFFALIRRVSDEAPADLRPLGVPDAVASAIEAGMAKSPADRPPTAAAFAEVLGDAAVRSGAGTEFVEPATSVSKATIHELPPDPTGAAPAAAIHPATVVAAGRVDDPQATIVEHAAGQAAGQAAPPDVTGPSTATGPGAPAGRRGRLLAGVAIAAVVVAGILAVVASRPGGGNGAEEDVASGTEDSGVADETNANASSGPATAFVSDPRDDPDPGQIVTVLGTGAPGDSADGPVADTMIDTPRGVVVADTISISEAGRSRVRILGDGFLTTVAGAPAAGEVAAPTGIDVLAGGIVFADAERHQIITVDPEGSVAVLAGASAQEGYTGDGGPATEATLRAPSGVAAAPDGSVYVSDSFNHVVRRIDVDGVITTVAGTGEAGYSGDGGPAIAAQLATPRGLAVAADGVVYVADGDNAAIRRIDLDGTITTIAGTGLPGFSGDGGPATAATLDGPHAIALGPDGALYVADTFNSTIRRIDAAGTITTVAGTGEPGGDGDGGPAAQAQLSNPEGVSINADGDIFIADTGNHAIRRVGAAG